MKILAALALIFGLSLLVGLTAYYGFTPVIQAVASAGWGVALVILARALGLAGQGVAWWFLLPAPAPTWRVFVGVRFIREAINSYFPFAVLGGDFIGARLLTQFGAGMSTALASVFIDIFILFACLLIFVSTGLGILMTRAEGHQLVGTTLFMLAIAIPAGAGFFLFLNFGAFEPLMKKLVEFGERRKWSLFGHVVGLGNSLQQVWRNRRGFAGSFLLHLVVIFFGATEVWIAVAFMGHSLSIGEAIVIESLGLGSRGAAFVLPGGLGVQDGTLIAVSAVFGVPAEVALALAFIKRIAEMVLGLPALWAWHVLEGRRQRSKDLAASGATPDH